MPKVLDELIELLALEKIEENLFRGQSQDLGWGAVFGGQVLGQALSAAVQTVPADRVAHSLQAYFLRVGNVAKPIVYDVDRIRDGSSFTTRRVVAIQSGQAIFNLAASFQKEEPGFDHQDRMPAAPAPEELEPERERMLRLSADFPRFVRERLTAERPFEIRVVEPDAELFSPAVRPPRRLMWMRADGPLPDDPALHRYLLAYASDLMLITTALLPHGATFMTPGMQVASLDHAMWFHRPLRVDEWLLFAMDSPSASGARGLARTQVFTRDGQLVASVNQEGLLRQRTR